MEFLSDKMKQHNQSYKSKRVSLNELKDVYYQAGKNFNADRNVPCHEWCLAKVNTFLRMKAGENVYFRNSSLEKKKATKIELENDPMVRQYHFDISTSLEPSDIDFDKTRREIEKENLNFNFKSIENLYLDDYKKIELDWN